MIKVFSPDGFTIEYEPHQYRSMKKAKEAFEKWKQNYQRQGYYSSPHFGRIPLEDLQNACTFYNTKKQTQCEP